MRAILGLLILGSLFVMAASWQNRTTTQLRDRRAMRYGIPSDSVAGPEGWGRLVLGRPSGAEPLPLPESPVDPQPFEDSGGGAWSKESGPSSTDIAQSLGQQTLVPADFEYTVQDDDVLGIICQKHYDRRPLANVVQAIATYNDLDSPDAIRSGDVLLLPDETVLFGGR
ncbi:MAG: LysM peptidoglycan-binding domain-containing protein [Planctomycetota bacterium]